MSLCNVTFDRDDAVSLWTDTAVATLEGHDLGEASKCWISPVLQAAVAIRGALPLLSFVGGLLACPYSADFDQALKSLAQGGLDAALKYARDACGDVGALQHLVVVGWSTSARRYRGASFLSSSGQSFEATPFGSDEPDMFAPWPVTDASISAPITTELGETPDSDDLQSMIAMAERQVAFIKGQDTGYAAGGRLQRTRLLPGGAGIEIAFVHTFAGARVR